MIDSAPAIRSYASIEHLEAVTRSLGWSTEYAQLKAGSFSSTVTELEGNGWFLMSEQSSLTVEVRAAAPPGMFVLATVEHSPAVINGRTLSADQLLLMKPDAAFRTTMPGGIKVTQVGVAAELLEDVAESIAPDLVLPPDGLAVLETASGRLAGARRALSTVLDPAGRAAAREETVSGALADLVAVLADGTSSSVTRRLHGAAARRALDQAREYIEAHLHGTIRVSAICRHAGIDLRSLERLFAREIGVSPQQYVKARRLNAARRDLLAAGTARITDVAIRHGLNHVGRFSGDYFRYFGEYPRDTLQRAR